MGKKIILWNTGGIKTKIKRDIKIERIRNLIEKPEEIFFIILQETHWTTIDDESTDLTNYDNLFEIRNLYASTNDSWNY